MRLIPITEIVIRRARLILHRKRVYDDGMIAQMRLWGLPEPLPGSSHGLKYSLFYGNHEGRLIGYDNERGKGDHRHYGPHEEAYRFTSPERLVADFLADVAAARRRC